MRVTVATGFSINPRCSWVLPAPASRARGSWHRRPSVPPHVRVDGPNHPSPDSRSRLPIRAHAAGHGSGAGRADPGAEAPGADPKPVRAEVRNATQSVMTAEQLRFSAARAQSRSPSALRQSRWAEVAALGNCVEALLGGGGGLGGERGFVRELAEEGVAI